MLRLCLLLLFLATVSASYYNWTVYLTCGSKCSEIQPGDCINYQNHGYKISCSEGAPIVSKYSYNYGMVYAPCSLFRFTPDCKDFIKENLVDAIPYEENICSNNDTIKSHGFVAISPLYKPVPIDNVFILFVIIPFFFVLIAVLSLSLYTCAKAYEAKVKAEKMEKRKRELDMTMIIKRMEGDNLSI